MDLNAIKFDLKIKKKSTNQIEKQNQKIQLVVLIHIFAWFVSKSNKASMQHTNACLAHLWSGEL